MDRHNNFTIIHILGAIFVVIGHQYVLMGESCPALLGWAVHGIGVKMLFLVSGYLIAMSYRRKHSRVEFLIKRLSRLYPAYIFCLLVTVSVFYFLTSSPQTYWISAKHYFWNNLTMRPVFGLEGVLADNIMPSVNGSLWSLPVELFCYVAIMPILDLYNLVEKKSKKAADCCFVLLVLSITAFVWHYETKMAGTMYVVWGTDIYSGIPLLHWFLIGSAFYLLDLKKYCNLQLAGVVLVFFTIFVGSYRNLFMPFVLGYLIMSFALIEKPYFATVIKHDVCYGIYLFSFPVQQVLIAFLQGKPGWTVNMHIILAVFITWVLAEITYRFVEHPVAEGVNKLLMRYRKTSKV